MKYILKNLQSLISVALCVFFATCFTYCSKDDDEPEKAKVEKRMKSIDKTSFVYFDGKITTTLWDGSVEDKIEYTASSIRIDNDTYYLTDGLVTKYVEYDGWYQEFTYENGHIKTWKKYYPDGTLDEDISFEWKDGVIVRQTVIWKGDEHMELIDYNYNYTTYPDYGGAIAALQFDFLFYDDLPEALIIQGYFGKWPKYLVSGAVDVSGYFDNAKSFTYILDNEGYPILMSGTEKAMFTWENL